MDWQNRRMMAAQQMAAQRPPGSMLSSQGAMMGSQGAMIGSQGPLMGSQGALSARSVTPLSSHMGIQPQMNTGIIMNAHENIGPKVQDLDQRLTLTEHANRAALDEVYGLRYLLSVNLYSRSYNIGIYSRP